MKKKVLIVDDETRLVKLLSTRLKSKNYDVHVAYDGIDGVKVAQREVPDLILLDIKMPYKGGIKAFEKLIQLEITKSIPVIFMSAFLSADIKARAKRMGANGFISKPFDSAVFDHIVYCALEDGYYGQF